MAVFGSISAIQTETDMEDTKRWISFWAIYAFTHIWNKSLGYIIYLILPGIVYDIGRVLFYLYLILPHTKGSYVIYVALLNPFLKDNKEIIANFPSYFDKTIIEFALEKYLQNLK